MAGAEASAAPWRAVPGGLVVAVRLTPRGGRDAIDGVETLSDGRRVLKARVSAAPEDGKANDALVRLVARACGVPARDVTLESGATSRLKMLKVAGDADALAARLSDERIART
jgi:uncharacterized protein (TIGR00251 family)